MKRLTIIIIIFLDSAHKILSEHTDTDTKSTDSHSLMHHRHRFYYQKSSLIMGFSQTIAFHGRKSCNLFQRKK